MNGLVDYGSDSDDSSINSSSEVAQSSTIQPSIDTEPIIVSTQSEHDSQEYFTVEDDSLRQECLNSLNKDILTERELSNEDMYNYSNNVNSPFLTDDRDKETAVNWRDFYSDEELNGTIDLTDAPQKFDTAKKFAAYIQKHRTIPLDDILPPEPEAKFEDNVNPIVEKVRAMMERKESTGVDLVQDIGILGFYLFSYFLKSLDLSI